MASEQIEIETPVAVDTTATATTTEEPAQAQQDGGKPRRQRAAPEDLFDLSKPIPKVRYFQTENRMNWIESNR